MEVVGKTGFPPDREIVIALMSGIEFPLSEFLLEIR